MSTINNLLISVTEGYMINGLLEGFARIIDDQGNVQKGYFSSQMSKQTRTGKPLKSTLISRPYGKWMHHDNQGKPITPDGLYKGDI